MTFLTKLDAAVRSRDSIICVGLDPEPERIPAHLGTGAQAAVRFLRKIITATSDQVCAYKPNLAFFERYGSAGADILGLTLQAIPGDIPIILDGKRGDVPNTATAYADALFGRLKADAATVSPYIGIDSIAPFCAAGYAFVLARTSNPGAGDFQDLVVAGRPLSEHVVERVVAAFPAESCGLVVGSTYPAESARIRALAPDRLFLMPGVGAQGGDLAAALRAALDARGGGVLPSASRSVLYAGSGTDFDQAAAGALAALRRQANDARRAGVR